MTLKNIIENFFGFAFPTYYRWKKEQRPVITFLEKYLSNQEIEEFLETGKIEKLDHVNLYLLNLNSKCVYIHSKIEHLDIRYKNLAYISHTANSSWLSSKNCYFLYLKPFVEKFKNELEKVANDYTKYKYNFFELAMQNHFQIKNNEIKEPYTTFQILSILDELNEYEFYYFFTKFDIMEDFK